MSSEKTIEAETFPLWEEIIFSDTINLKFKLGMRYSHSERIYRYTITTIDEEGREMDQIMSVPLYFKPIKSHVRKGNRLFAHLYEAEKIRENATAAAEEAKLKKASDEKRVLDAQTLTTQAAIEQAAARIVADHQATAREKARRKSEDRIKANRKKAAQKKSLQNKAKKDAKDEAQKKADKEANK